jgi:lipopolysaccharide export system protein LptA
MNPFIFSLAVALTLGAGAVAAAELAAKPAAAGDTVIDAELLEYRPDFDVNGGLLIYSGSVRVQNPRVRLLCDRLVIFLPKNGDQPNRIEAQTNVVIIKISQGETTRATCSRAVYTHLVTSGSTNTIITLSGEPLPYIESPKATTTGNPIIWNLTTGKIEGSNNRTVIKMNALGGSTTNQLPDKIF